MKIITTAIFSTLLLAQAGCTFIQDDPCESIQFSAEQQQKCAQLQGDIARAKGRPIIRTELERRFENDCINIRYYRDDITNERCNERSSDVLPAKEEELVKH